jgi:Domain of unknown function (DUF4911)
LIFVNADVTDIPAFLMRTAMIECHKRYFRLPARHIAHFQFLVEGYDGIATVTTVDSKAAVLMLCIPDGLETEVDRVLDAMAQERLIPFREDTGWKEEFGVEP